MNVSAPAYSAGALLDLLHTNAGTRGNRVAYRRPRTGDCQTFADLAAAATLVSAWLAQMNVQPGDAVAYFVADDPFFIPLLAACAQHGARLVPIDPALHQTEARSILTHCQPRLVIAPTGQRDRWLPHGATTTLVTPGQWTTQPAATRPAATRVTGDTEPCLVLYTAGTTGEPKPVLLSALNLLNAAKGFLRSHPLTADDVILSVSPFSIANGVALGAIIPMIGGVEAICAGPFDPATYWQCVLDHQATICDASPRILSALLRSTGTDRPAGRLPRFFLCSGDILHEGLRAQFERQTGTPIHQGYGLTETSFWAACSAPHEPGSNHHAALRPVDHCDITIRPLRSAIPLPPDWGPADRDRPPPQRGAFGEILIRGPLVSAGYYKRNNLTHTAFDQGFLRTGDLGWMDGPGNLVVRGRLKDLLSRDGQGVLSEDIDWFWGQHPGLADHKTIILPGPGRGDQFVSVCVPREPPSDALAAELMQWITHHADAPTRPDRVICAAALPRDPAGRVSAGLLRQMVSGALRDEILSVLTGRKYRRSPAFQEDLLRERVQAAIMAATPIEFLMLWGCGDRDSLAEPDIAALAALGEILAEPRRLPHIRTGLHIMFTDQHAATNGRSIPHYQRYFQAIRDAAAGLDIDFSLESDLWADHGLTHEAIDAFEQTPDFLDYWDRFPLREKFVAQATRHSASEDPVAAGRHYLATCRMERGLMQQAHPMAVFLTYNGPEFNDCFPALPTLYIYPGARGRTVKPWFV